MAEAATLDQMPPAGLPDETEEQRRQRLAQPQLPIPNAMPPAQIQAAPAQTQPAAPVMPPATVPPTQAPANANAAPSTMPPAGTGSNSPIATPPFVDSQKMPPGPQLGPAQKRYADLSAQGPPKLPAWKQILDTIGSLHPLGRELEANIPGSPQNYSVRMNQAAVRAAKEQELAGTNQKQAEEKQKGEREAQEATMIEIPGHPEYGKVELKNYPAILKQIEANTGKTDTANINQTGATTREQMKIDSKPAIANGIKFGVLKPDIVAQIGPMPEDPEELKKWGEEYDKLAGKSNKTGLGTYAMVRLLDYFQKYNPEGLQMMPQILKQAGIEMPPGVNIPAIPPGQPTDESGKPIGNAQPGAPTSQTRTMGQMAEKVLPRIPAIRKEIEAVKDYLGPAEGRANVEFLLGEVGSTGNPQRDRQLAGLKTDLAMLGSGAARFHINSVQAMEEMLRQVPLGKASPEALNGALDKIEEWAQGAANEGRGRPASQTAPASPGGALPPGWK
jgi:hypothetical protein